MGNDYNFCSISNFCCNSEENLSRKIINNNPSPLKNIDKNLDYNETHENGLTQTEQNLTDISRVNLTDKYLNTKNENFNNITNVSTETTNQVIICEKIKEEIDPINDVDSIDINEHSLENTTYVLNSIMSLFPDNEYTYIGFKQANKKEGLGMQIFHRFRSYYFGTFQSDSRVGLCKYVNKSKDYIYKGFINSYYAEGYGILTNEKITSQYEGYFHNSKRHSIGHQQFDNNSEYFGEFSEGKRNGIGKYIWNDGTIYEGEWKDNIINGYGIFRLKGSIYKGCVQNNLREGYGEFIQGNSKNIKIYFGYFKESKKNGFGVMYYNCNNEKRAFIGFWKEDKQNGFGVYFINGMVKYGIWNNGKRCKKYDSDSEFNNELSVHQCSSNNLKGNNIFFKFSLEQIEEYINNKNIVNLD